MKRHRDDIEHELEQAIFNSLYRTPRQRLLRIASIGLMMAKHGLRGLLYVWPLTLLLFIEFPGYWNWAKLILIGLAIAAWFRFIFASVRDDYGRFVKGKILDVSHWRKVL